MCINKIIEKFNANKFKFRNWRQSTIEQDVDKNKKETWRNEQKIIKQQS